MGYSMAVDGPAGAGKSTIAKLAAKELGLIYIDTGAMYRAIGLHFINNDIVPEDSEAAKIACDGLSINIKYEEGIQQIYLNGENVSARIRMEEVGKMASAVAKLPFVRSKLVDIQRQLAKNENVIMDGRDIGTCVLPDANVKIYLTANSRVRAQRRYNELVEKNIKCDIDEIEASIIARDYEDMHREISPLRQADDAILLDTSDMDIAMVVNSIKNIYEESLK
ncbi:MAG: (d)CMP kinase [Lachnospiraceae bacterium]|nr:(d)CMP kinase [Lachnospiraceae bacterium]